ncbi:hypothetical protein J7I98_04370 [Streptomyces sp. ISL-98]|uniref:hypothetical protein n=1 Tax=Streptomyces sp. ISL-98 TaxID=2819192 RepID=UPI001BE67C2D|nr:hypothetical protein [Streptomyces sp. ISL-98]MBT2505143.1 hypothetical protein [Streptomyces sp. ISL-98]
MSGIDWGDAPTWAGVMFAAAAAYGALATMNSQRRQLSEQREFINRQMDVLALEHQDLGDALEARRRQQAQLVKFQYDLIPVAGTVTGARHWRIRVHNQSSGPVRQVSVAFGTERPTRAALTGKRRDEWVEYDGSVVVGDVVEVLGAGKAGVFYSRAGEREELTTLRPVVNFLDGVDIAWTLNEFGLLTESTVD